MKTKFILCGGVTSSFNAKNDAFFREVLKDAPNNPRVLLVFFAKEENMIPVSKEGDIAQFERSKGDKKLSFEVADKEHFERQVKKNDIIYFHGGTTSKLLKTLKKIPNLKKLLKGKTVVGESAGASVLSSCFYNKSEGGVFDGLDLVPVKTMCHYAGMNENKLIDECPADLELLLLPNYKYKVFYEEPQKSH